MILKRTQDRTNDELTDIYRFSTPKTFVTIDDIKNEFHTHLYIIDNNENILRDFLTDAKFTQSLSVEKIMATITTNKYLKVLKNSGLMSIRTVDELSNIGLIIVNKTKVYVSLSSQTIIPITTDDKELDDLLEFFNFQFWCKTTQEQIKDKTRSLTDDLLVVEPKLSHLSKIPSNVKATTVDIERKSEYRIIPKLSKFVPNSIIVENCDFNVAATSNNIYFRLYEDKYLVSKGSKIMDLSTHYSLQSEKIGNLIGEQIIYKNKKVSVKEETTVIDKVLVTLDKYINYKYDFNTLFSKCDNLVGKLHAEVTVDILTLDKSYKIHSNYKYVEQLRKDIDKELIKFENSFENGLKKTASIRKETNLESIVAKANKMFNSLEDLESENPKSKKIKFKKFNYDLNKAIVPPINIGDLYTKSQKNYLAVESKEKLEKALEWINNSDVTAEVILKS